MLTIALSKGRILDETLPLFAAAGIEPAVDPSRSRKLILESTRADIRFVIIRAADVPTYVQFGAADAGVVGKDLLLEHGGEGLYELLDLKIAACRLVVAEPAELAAGDDPSSWSRLRIATKYPRITRKHFAAKGVQTEIIKLYGSMELAPLVKLSDRIVDLVATGGTLHANGLVEVEKIADITSRLVVNRASMKTRGAKLNSLIESLKEAVGTASAAA
ncbi:MAG: ATP phosphoribosyltransferase 2 [marine bacterium B5-7]|nr:MAG: ATP phosphoribosyltransferase 2 [marine bacterium B5-7]